MDSKVYIMNGERYKQVEVEVDQMDEDKTVLFLVPEKEEWQCISDIQNLLWACHFTVPEVMDEMKEAGKQIYYICTMYDDRVEHEYTAVKEKNKDRTLSLDEKMSGAAEKKTTKQKNKDSMMRSDM